MGTYLPLTMFSGEESITVVKESFAEFAPWILIISGVLKLVLTNICIKSGWKGGHFFPVIFFGVSKNRVPAAKSTAMMFEISFVERISVGFSSLSSLSS